MIKVYGFPHSRSLRITWLLEELGLEYDYQLINLSKGDNRAVEFLAINPAGKVPVIEDDGLVIFESAAIVSHLSDKYGDAQIIPAPGTDKDYLMGAAFSAVDILVAHTLNWGVKFEQPIPQANLNAYRERVMARPARAKALARETQSLEG